MVVQAGVFSCARGDYHRRAFRRRDACALCKAKRLRRLPGCAAFTIPLRTLPPPASVVQAVVILARVAPTANAWKAGVLACDGCAGGGIFLRTRRLPPPSVSQARRLRSLQIKAPSAVARLRSVHHPSEDVTTACVGCAGGSNFGQSRPHGECLESRRPRLRFRGPGLPSRRIPPPSVSQARRLLSRLALRSPFL